MANKLLILGLGLTAMLPAISSPAPAADMIPGEYSGNCDPNPEAGCVIVVETIRSGKTYKVTFETFVPSNSPQSARCSVSGVATLHNGRLLVGEFGPGKPFEILRTKTSEMIVGKTDNRPCGRTLKVNGVYQPVGD